MLQYFLGLASGIVAASIGAYLTVWFESKKEKQKDSNIFESFKEELISNLEMLSANSVELEDEVEIADNEQHLLTSLTPYYFPTWDILKTRIPNELSEKETLRKLSLLMHFVLLINNEMESRERFKINGASLSNFGQTLKKRDQVLLMRNETLLIRILELQKELNLDVKFRSPSKTLSEAHKKSKKN